MAQILPRTRYDDIRYALDPTLDETAIPDSVIESFTYLPAAERWAVSLDSQAVARVGQEQEYLYQAIILYTAGLLSQVTPQTRQANMGGHTMTLVYAETTVERTGRLLGAAHDAIAAYMTPTEFPTYDGPVFVTTVSGRRG